MVDGLHTQTLNASDADAETVCKGLTRNVSPYGVNCGATSARCVGQTNAKIRNRECGGSCIGEDAEIDRPFLLENEGELRDEILATNAREVRSNTRTDCRREDAESEEIRQRRSFACPIEPEIVASELTMRVVERVIRVALVVQWANASVLEPRTEPKPPSERGLDVPCKGSGGCAIRRQLGVEMVVRHSERQ